MIDFLPFHEDLFVLFYQLSVFSHVFIFFIYFIKYRIFMNIFYFIHSSFMLGFPPYRTSADIAGKPYLMKNSETRADNRVFWNFL